MATIAQRMIYIMEINPISRDSWAKMYFACNVRDNVSYIEISLFPIFAVFRSASRSIIQKAYLYKAYFSLFQYIIRKYVRELS